MKAQELVQEIHNAFDNAQDVLLKEAREIINANKVSNAPHVKKMEELGFVNSKVVKKASARLRKAVETAKQAEIVLYYREEYPFLKFLTEEKLDEICEKYNLIYAPVGNYLEDVPEKNLKEIEAAKPLNPKDARSEEFHTAKFKGKHGTQKERKALENFRVDTKGYSLYTSQARVELDRLGLGKHKLYLERFEFTARDTGGLFIAAPKHHFDLSNLSNNKERSFFQLKTTKLEDPIVFRYVKHGIQVLSKWGLEANDPELANPIDN
jgi:DNA-binding MarR family transcriptional regulator